MEKASELLLKFATFGKKCKEFYPHNSILPIVHGDTLVAGITPLWLGYRIILVRMTATEYALIKYDLAEMLDKLAADFPFNFVQTSLWKEYGHVVEFLDSGSCWLELTDSGSMQEELLYFPKVGSITVRLNTDRPETIFDANDNILAPPLNARWLVEIVRLADQDKLPSARKKHKKRIYGEPGTVSQKIIKILKKNFDEESNFFPWLHNRLRSTMKSIMRRAICEDVSQRNMYSP